MALEEEIQLSAKEISTDGYEMSIGEIISLYKDDELIINPEFQRYFRWDISRKTKFVESILLGIPIPPIFVFQTDDGRWELVDGLQRISTLLEYIGILKNKNGTLYTPSILEGTKLLPSLADKSWEERRDTPESGIGKTQQLEVRRARMRVEILKKESDPQSKYELFQRLNTGGDSLTEQEVRNCVLIMVNKDFYHWISQMAENDKFKKLVSQTRNAEQKQKVIELALRFFVYKNVPYKGGLDVHEYLDTAAVKLASDKSFDYAYEERVFKKTIDLMFDTMGADIFKRYDGTRFKGKFVLSSFEAIAIGVANNLQHLDKMSATARDNFIKAKVKNLWSDALFVRFSGAGIRGTTRLTQLLPFSQSYFRP